MKQLLVLLFFVFPFFTFSQFPIIDKVSTELCELFEEDPSRNMSEVINEVVAKYEDDLDSEREKFERLINLGTSFFRSGEYYQVFQNQLTYGCETAKHLNYLIIQQDVDTDLANQIERRITALVYSTYLQETAKVKGILEDGGANFTSSLSSLESSMRRINGYPIHRLTKMLDGSFLVSVKGVMDRSSRFAYQLYFDETHNKIENIELIDFETYLEKNKANSDEKFKQLRDSGSTPPPPPPPPPPPKKVVEPVIVNGNSEFNLYGQKIYLPGTSWKERGYSPQYRQIQFIDENDMDVKISIFEKDRFSVYEEGQSAEQFLLAFINFETAYYKDLRDSLEVIETTDNFRIWKITRGESIKIYLTGFNDNGKVVIVGSTSSDLKDESELIPLLKETFLLN